MKGEEPQLMRIAGPCLMMIGRVGLRRAVDVLVDLINVLSLGSSIKRYERE